MGSIHSDLIVLKEHLALPDSGYILNLTYID